MKNKIFYLQIFFIIVSLYVFYNIYNKSQKHKYRYIEGLETKKNGYITKMRKYHNKNIMRPLRLKKDDIHKNLKEKYNKFKKWLI